MPIDKCYAMAKKKKKRKELSLAIVFYIAPLITAKKKKKDFEQQNFIKIEQCEKKGVFIYTKVTWILC